jgi:hypothetical protein
MTIPLAGWWSNTFERNPERQSRRRATATKDIQATCWSTHHGGQHPSPCGIVFCTKAGGAEDVGKNGKRNLGKFRLDIFSEYITDSAVESSPNSLAVVGNTESSSKRKNISYYCFSVSRCAFVFLVQGPTERQPISSYFEETLIIGFLILVFGFPSHAD